MQAHEVKLPKWWIAARVIACLSLTAACGGHGNERSAPVASASQASTEWRGLAEDCPVLTQSPYGLPTHGKVVATARVEDAAKFEAVCEYVAPAHLPMLSARISIDLGVGSVARTTHAYDAERTAAGNIIAMDVVDLSQVGDAAFAVYDQATWTVFARARSGNATVVLQFLIGRDIAESWSVTAPLSEQVPILSAVAKSVLGNLA